MFIACASVSLFNEALPHYMCKDHYLARSFPAVHLNVHGFTRAPGATGLCAIAWNSALVSKKNWLAPTVNREVRWVRRDTRLTIRVTVWGRGLGGAKSQRVGRLRCRTQQGLSPAPERTGELAPLTPFYSNIVPVVQFFGRSSFLPWQSWLVCLRLT